MCHMPTLLQGLRRCRHRGRGHGLGHRPGRRHRRPPRGPRRRRHRGGRGGGARASSRSLQRPGGQGPDQLGAQPRRPSSASPRSSRSPSSRRARWSSRRSARTSTTKRALFTALVAALQPADTVLATQHLQPRRHGHRRRHAGARTASSACTSSTRPPPCASSRWSAGQSRRPRSLERGDRADARLGQDAGAVRLDPRASSSTGSPARSTARPSGCSWTGVADPATLDARVRSAGFRMGPLELTDFIGQDVNLAVGTQRLGADGPRPALRPDGDCSSSLVAAGHLGRKTGQGVYRYGPDGTALDAVPDEARAGRARSPARSRPTRWPAPWPCSSTRRSTWCTAARPAPRTSTPP